MQHWLVARELAVCSCWRGFLGRPAQLIPSFLKHLVLRGPPLQGKVTTGLYEKWSKKTRLRVATDGSEEQGARLAAQMADR